ncbi:MAG TPA: D-alanyl-D-alanine carboxypeptidase/D-alanyl-D-alanine-endopeptidase [Gaiellales bacterium]|nr:D-alanyl-D-alanine carboxypeptidase/D-alanyl-D-alanine-endopeptidase [Gaiellales bacterium]
MMRRLRSSLILALGLLAIAFPVANAAGGQTTTDVALARGIAKALAAHGFSGQGTGVAVADLATGDVIYQRNGAIPMVPASTEKLFTSVAALSTLHPDFRFATTVVGVGTRVGPTWNGDLYLVGSGDPTFSSYDIDALAAQVKARGIRRISGRIRGDETVFDSSRWGPWPVRYIGVESPPLSGLALDRDVTTNGRDVASPSHSAARALRRALKAAGVKVGVHFVAGGRAPKGALVLGRVQSDPLWQIVRFMDRHSDNFTAEMVAKAVGAYAGGSGTTERGMHVAGEVAAPMLGEDAPLVHLADGSGLSHANRTTAAALARLLAGAAANPAIAKPFAGALSVAGANGTLAHRLRGLRGRVLGKSGTLDNVSALAGYVTGLSGRRFAFAVLMNVPALSDWDAHAAQDAIVKLLAKR